MTTTTSPSKWTDPAALASYITSLLAGAAAVIALLHPGFKEPANVQVWVTAVSGVIAGGIQLANLITHRSLTKTIVKATPNA